MYVSIPTARQMEWPATLTPSQRWLHVCTQLIDMQGAIRRARRYEPGPFGRLVIPWCAVDQDETLGSGDYQSKNQQ